MAAAWTSSSCSKATRRGRARGASLVGIDEEGTLARLRSLRVELIEPAIAAHRGRIINTAGDGILVEFPSIVDAARCALAVQRGMAQRNAEIAADLRIAFRMGIARRQRAQGRQSPAHHGPISVGTVTEPLNLRR